MSKRKPLSAEEKRVKLLELFHETNDVFSLKDLERLAPTAKGIVKGLVKGVLEELVDGGLVYCENVAVTKYYWAFTSDALNSKTHLLDKSESTGKLLQNKITNAEQQLAVIDSAESDHVEAIATHELEIKHLNDEKKELQLRVGSVAAKIDYAQIQAKTLSLQKIREGANRWTDNIFSIRTWCKREFGADEKQINTSFEIRNDLDYLSE